MDKVVIFLNINRGRIDIVEFLEKLGIGGLLSRFFRYSITPALHLINIRPHS